MIPAMAPLIRAAGMSDIPELVALDREAFGEHAYSAGTTRQLLELFEGLVLLAEDGGVRLRLLLRRPGRGEHDRMDAGPRGARQSTGGTGWRGR